MTPLVHRDRVMFDDELVAWWCRGRSALSYARWMTEHQRQALADALFEHVHGRPRLTEEKARELLALGERLRKQYERDAAPMRRK